MKTIHVDGKSVVLLEIGAAFRHPVRFKKVEYIRVGSYKKVLKDFPEIERELWRTFDRVSFEEGAAASRVEVGRVLELLDYVSYFELLELPPPESHASILDALEADRMICRDGDLWNITNMGAILFAKRLGEFPTLSRKSVRVVVYEGEQRIYTIREQVGGKGYANGFAGLLEFVEGLLPRNEVIGTALRKEVAMFPMLAVRELVANALIHQDFFMTGVGPMIEIFDGRIEVTNPGLPLVKTDRFLDSPPRSRNEALASFMRRVGICEERGSGVDKVVSQTELYQLPAPLFEEAIDHTRAVLFAHREFRAMDRSDRQRACYLHACLRYVQRDYMTNSTLRERFGIDVKNSSMVSRIIKDSLDVGLIRCHDDEVGSRARKYLPSWA